MSFPPTVRTANQDSYVREVILPPAAPAMLESLRALGYSFEAAVADIIDNSIAASASRIDVQFRPQPHPYLAILDDGHGMSAAQLVDAMRHGGVGPTQKRELADLGRFGLGLKTASLSQCRRLTVVSSNGAAINAATWNLDRVEESGDWVVGILSEAEINALPHVADLIAGGRGTMVLWEHFDRATAGETDPGNALGALVDLTRDHLSLVFHRFLSGTDGGRRLTVSINNAALVPLDPYLSKHRGTQALPPETLRVEGAEVTLRPFILPHLSRMSKDDLLLAGGEDGLRRNQGFYVYRNRRLITYGTWFRLLRQEELTKLARVQVDISNELDHLWALDVKKSRAHPPEAVRLMLLRVVERIAGTSRHVYRFRGRRSSGEVTHVWERIAIRDGVAYQLNRSHPIVTALFDVLDDAGDQRLEQLLKAIEIALPTDTIYADMASERRVQSSPEDQEMEVYLTDVATRMVGALGPDSATIQRLLDSLSHIEPFSSHPAVAIRVVEGIRNGRQ